MEDCRGCAAVHRSSNNLKLVVVMTTKVKINSGKWTGGGLISGAAMRGMDNTTSIGGEGQDVWCGGEIKMIVAVTCG